MQNAKYGWNTSAHDLFVDPRSSRHMHVYPTMSTNHVDRTCRESALRWSSICFPILTRLLETSCHLHAYPAAKQTMLTTRAETQPFNGPALDSKLGPSKNLLGWQLDSNVSLLESVPTIKICSNGLPVTRVDEAALEALCKCPSNLHPAAIRELRVDFIQ